MAKKHRAGDNEAKGPETTEKKEGPIEAQLKRISSELGGYSEMVKKLERDPRFKGINKSTFSYWIRQEQNNKIIKTERLQWALDILGDNFKEYQYIKISYVNNIWNLPATLVCWQPPASRGSQDSDFPDLKTIGLGQLRKYGIVAEVDYVKSGTEALKRLRDDSGCAIAIVASDLIEAKGKPRLEKPFYRVCPISRTQIEGMTREPVEEWAQLRGQKLGYPDGSAVSDVVLDFFGKRGKRPPTLIELPGDDAAAIAAALRSGKIQGFLGWQPQLAKIEAEVAPEIDLNPIPLWLLPRMKLEVVINYKKIRSPGLIWDFLSAIHNAVEGIEGSKRSKKDKLAGEVAELLGAEARRLDKSIKSSSIMSSEDVEKSLQSCKFLVPYIYADVAIKLYADVANELARPAKRPGDTDG